MPKGNGLKRTNNTGRPVPNFVVLALGELDEKFCDLVLDFYLTQNRRSVVRYSDFAIG